MPDRRADYRPELPHTYRFGLSPESSLARRIWMFLLVGLMYVGLGYVAVPVASPVSGPSSEEGDPRL